VEPGYNAGPGESRIFDGAPTLRYTE